MDVVSPPAATYTGGSWHGRDVVPYGADDPATTQRLIDLGVDGLVTKLPVGVVAVAIRNGLR